MMLGERTLVKDSIQKLLGWAVRLEHPLTHCRQLRGRKIYSAALLLRAFRFSTILRDKGNLLQALSAASEVMYPGLIKFLEEEGRVESMKVPSASHSKRAHFIAELCFLEFQNAPGLGMPRVMCSLGGQSPPHSREYRP